MWTCVGAALREAEERREDVESAEGVRATRDVGFMFPSCFFLKLDRALRSARDESSARQNLTSNRRGFIRLPESFGL